MQKTYLIYFEFATSLVSGADVVTAGTSCPSISLRSWWLLTSSYSTFCPSQGSSWRSRKNRVTKICGLFFLGGGSLYMNCMDCWNFIQWLSFMTSFCSSEQHNVVEGKKRICYLEPLCTHKNGRKYLFAFIHVFIHKVSKCNVGQSQKKNSLVCHFKYLKFSKISD